LNNIPLFKIFWDNNDLEKVAATLKKGANWAIGPEVEEFETAIANYLGVKYAVTLNSGTSALHVALAVCNIGPGDEVIVPSFSFIATANAALFVGAKPIFAEIEEKYYGLDPNDVERKITKQTKAIIPVHYAGGSCLIEDLSRIAKKHNLLLIEDAAEAIGTTIHNRMVGTIGDIGILSFCQNKIITTGEGGAIVTNNREIYEKAKLIRSHGRANSVDYFSTADYIDYITLGYNFRMSNITASLGLTQIQKIEQIINMRRSNAIFLNSAFAGLPQITTPFEMPDSRHVYQMYTIKLTSNSLRNSLIGWLTQKGVSTKVYFYPIHLSGFYKEKFGYKEGYLPVTERISSEVLTLPMFPGLTKGEIDTIVNETREFLVGE
jgi:dTDP-4-amino-4,6-dideoxygalactose transaminase